MSGSVITTDNGKQYQKPGFLRTAAGVAVGAITADFTREYAPSAVNNILNRSLTLKNIYFSEPLDEFAKAAEKAFEKSGLSEKGIVWLKEINPENIKKLIDAKAEKFDKETNNLKKLFKNFPKILAIIEKIRAKEKHKMIKYYEKQGEIRNCFFAGNVNIIFCDLKTRSRFAFHEMGHALNKHGKSAVKILTNLKPLDRYALIPLAIALLKRKKVEDERTEGFFDKITTFVKNHAGLLAFSLSIPKLAEEALASVQGYKLAKEFLSEKQLTRLRIFQGRAWFTYFVAAAAAGIGTFCASKVRDIIAKPEKLSYFDTVYTKVPYVPD